jgi:CIC family chloride channel protein
MLASALCLVINHKFSLYEHQVDNKFDSPAHIEDATINILENLQVKDHYNPERPAVIEEGTTLYALQDSIAHTAELAVPLRNTGGEFSGLLSVEDVRRYLFDTCMLDLLVAKEVAKPFVALHPEDDLYTALLKFVDTDYGQIPVVGTKDPTELLGLINREDVFQAYHRAIDSLKSGAESEELPI